MKKIIKLSLLLVVMIMISGCEKSNMKEISFSDYEKLIEDKETFILEIMRTDCSACINFKPKIEQVANDYNIEIKYINTDHITEEENTKLLELTGINGTPTVIFYNNGIEETISSRINGSVSQDKIISKLKANGFIE